MTEAPLAASFSAATAPIPAEAPVSRIRLPARSTGRRDGRCGSGRIPASRIALLMSGLATVGPLSGRLVAAGFVHNLGGRMVHAQQID
jgi:hypothetical protein